MSGYEQNNGYSAEGDQYMTINSLASNIGDFTPFYLAIAICSVLLGLILILNIICCCSSYADYWLDRHTGNRLLVSIWSTTPHKQPPLDLTELESAEVPVIQYRSPVPPSVSQQPLATSREYLELHKRESDI